MRAVVNYECILQGKRTDEYLADRRKHINCTRIKKAMLFIGEARTEDQSLTRASIREKRVSAFESRRHSDYITFIGNQRGAISQRVDTPDVSGVDNDSATCRVSSHRGAMLADHQNSQQIPLNRAEC